MKQKLSANIFVTCLFLLTAPFQPARGQAGCVLQPPLVHIDFGNSQRPEQLTLSSLENYNESYHYCPQDGNYAIAASTSDCFGGHWITLNQDHTPNDVEGKMMLVNASYTPGIFFATPINGLAGNTTYELSAWIVNVCTSCINDIPLSPQLSFIIENTSGKQLVNFVTGEVRPTGTSRWIQYSGLFTTPANAGPLFLKIANKVRGGCGNDFAMDDITIRECRVPAAVVKDKPKPKPVIKQALTVKKPLSKIIPPVFKPVKKDIPVITKIPGKDTPVIYRPAIKLQTVIALPKPILTRDNPIIKKIETGDAEIIVDLYDNGEIDGDTVSIYHNNVLIVSRAALSAKAVTFRISIDAVHPHHELVMVANNLGSIPPNTSLMIVTARDKRYEVFISSSEQKNAKVVIELKK